MSSGKPTRSASTWLNDWRLHAASGVVLLLLTLAVLANKQIGGENRRAARPMNPTQGARLDGEFKPQSRRQATDAAPAATAGMGSIQRGGAVTASVGTSLAVDLDAGWLSDLPAVAAASADEDAPAAAGLQLTPGHSLALAIVLPTEPAEGKSLALQLGSTSIEVRTTDGHLAFACRGQALGKVPTADGKVVLWIHREQTVAGVAAEPADAGENVLRWVLTAGDEAVGGRVQLDGLEPAAEIHFPADAPADGAPTIAAARFGQLSQVPEVAMPAVRFSH